MMVKLIFTFLIGCCFGSFLNVIIYRLPLGDSIIFPSSHCTKCNYKISWYENIPIVSWVLLSGRCSKCKEKISLIYPIIELLTGILFLLNNYSFNSRLDIGSELIPMLSGWILISILLVMAILDIKYFWLPDIISRFGILVAIFLSVFLKIRYEELISYLFIFETILAAFLGYLIFKAISAIGLRIYGKPVMGKGDAKLAALIGSWLGLKGLLISIWLAFFFAGILGIIGLTFRKIKKDQKIPFGSFLSLAGLFVWYFGNDSLINLIVIGR
tara:strand:- start:743 stop:1555 length:813 start_codon:yes stop_codon:yes gene_type:complete